METLQTLQQTLQTCAPQAHEALFGLPDPTYNQIGSTVLRLAHESTIIKGGFDEFLSYKKVSVAEHTQPQAEAHSKVGELMGHVGGYLATAHTAVEELKKQKTYDDYGYYPELNIYDKAKAAACDDALRAHEQGDNAKATTAIESIFALSMLGNGDDCSDQIRQLVSVGMAEEVVRAADDMHAVIALPDKYGHARSALPQYGGVIDLLQVATRCTFDEQIQHKQSLDGLVEVDRSNELRRLHEKLSVQDHVALAVLEVNVHHNPDEALRNALAAGEKTASQVFSRVLPADIVSIISIGADCASKISDESMQSRYHDMIDKLRARRSAGREQRYRHNNPQLMAFDGALVQMAVEGNREGVMALVSSSPQEVENIIHPLKFLGFSEADAIAAKKFVEACSAEKRATLQETLAKNGAPEKVFKTSVNMIHDPDGMGAIPKDFWDMYEDGKNLHVDQILFGENAFNQPKIASIIMGLVASGIKYAAINRNVVLNLTGLDHEQTAAYLRQVAELTKGVKDIPHPAQETFYAKTLDKVLEFQQPGDLFTLTSRLYGEDNLDRLAEVGSMLMDDRNWLNGFHTLNGDKMARIDRALADGLAEMYSSCTVSAKDAVIKYLVSGGDEGDLSSFETIKQLQGEGVFSYTGVAVQDELITTAVFSAQNPLERFNSLKQLQKDGLFDVDEQLRPQILDFVLRNSDPEAAYQLIKSLHQQNVFLREAHRTFGKVGEEREFGLDIAFMSHPQEWVSVLSQIPDGKRGDAIREKMVDRLFLPHRMAHLKEGAFSYAEDPIQAVRVFTEVAATPHESIIEQLNPMQLELMRLLVHAGDGIVSTDANGATIGFRGFPSTNPNKLRNTFYDEELADLYCKLFDAKKSGAEALDMLLEQHPELKDAPTIDPSKLPEYLTEMRLMTDYYRKEPGAAEIWLNQFATEPIKATKLISAWQSRALALTYRDKDDPGFRVADNPKSILDFVASHGVEVLVEAKMKSGETDLTKDELRSFKDWILALGSRYQPQTSVHALERVARYKREHGSYDEKILAANTTVVMIEDRVTREDSAGQAEVLIENKQVTAAVLSVDDPGGFTIGYDTGCCMTLGGASESCIWAGYEDPRYAFFTVRESNGKLRAQSIIYVTEEMGKKYLVVDNIEANQGTDVSEIASVYKKALVQFIEKQGLDIAAIQIGKGYVQDGILSDLAEATIKPKSPKAGTYSDAASQKVLWVRE